MSNRQGTASRIFNRHGVGALAIFIFLSFSSLATAQVHDPWRSGNEKIYRFNDFFDTLLVKPLARTYNLFLPRFARQGIGNFFSNVDDINVFVNNLLQLKFNSAASDSGRFAINTTLGVAGIFDVATSLGLYKNEEDFGQTLGYWGVGTGPYVVLPVFGPSNVRDAFGLVLDTVFNPNQYHDEDSLRFAIWMLEEVDTRSSVLSLDELIVGDKYLFYREAYSQRREYLVNDGLVDDPFGDF